MQASDFALIAAVNDDEILASCLARSPDVVEGRLTISAIRGARNMAEAYNSGLDRTVSRFAIFAHQDVYLPRGWLDRAIAVLQLLESEHADWMVAGPYGVTADGTHMGRVWDVGIGKELGTAGFGKAPVVSLDELLLILRRDSDYRFDRGLPHFHLYGTDLAQSCIASGRSVWALELPLVHNSQVVSTLRGGYTAAHRYLRRKWWDRLPIPTSVTPLTRNPLRILKAQWAMRNAPARTGELLADAVEVAALAGYE